MHRIPAEHVSEYLVPVAEASTGCSRRCRPSSKLTGDTMNKFHVGFFVGSLSANSINRKLAQALVRLAPDTLRMTEIRYGDLPLYNRDFDADYPAVAREFKAAIA